MPILGHGTKKLTDEMVQEKYVSKRSGESVESALEKAEKDVEDAKRDKERRDVLSKVDSNEITDVEEEAAGARVRQAQRQGEPTETMPKWRQQAQERDQRRGRASLQRPCRRGGSRRKCETSAGEAEQAYRDVAGEEAADATRARPAQRQSKRTETMPKRRQS